VPQRRRLKALTTNGKINYYQSIDSSSSTRRSFQTAAAWQFLDGDYVTQLKWKELYRSLGKNGRESL